MQHSVPLRTRSGSHAHAGWRDFIISTVDLMMPAELEALLGRSERPRSCTLMGARGPSTSSCTHISQTQGQCLSLASALEMGGSTPLGRRGSLPPLDDLNGARPVLENPRPLALTPSARAPAPSLSRLHVRAAARAVVGSSDAATQQGPGRPTRALRRPPSRPRRSGGRTRRDFQASRLRGHKLFTLSFVV